MRLCAFYFCLCLIVSSSNKRCLLSFSENSSSLFVHTSIYQDKNIPYRCSFNSSILNQNVLCCAGTRTLSEAHNRLLFTFAFDRSGYTVITLGEAAVLLLQLLHCPVYTYCTIHIEAFSGIFCKTVLNTIRVYGIRIVSLNDSWRFCLQEVYEAVQF